MPKDIPIFSVYPGSYTYVVRFRNLIALDFTPRHQVERGTCITEFRIRTDGMIQADKCFLLILGCVNSKEEAFEVEI